MDSVAGHHFIDCSICQSIFQVWGFRRLVQDHDSIDNKSKLAYLKKECMSSAVLSSLISMTNHRFHNNSMYVWHTVIDLESLQNAKKKIQGCPDMVISEKISTYDIKETNVVFICRSGMHFYIVVLQTDNELEHNEKHWMCHVYDSLETTAPQKKIELHNLFLQFNIHPEKIQINVVNSKKQQDGSSCWFYAFFYFYHYICNDSVDEKYLKDSFNCSENSDMV
jgi:hypothetical protein